MIRYTQLNEKISKNQVQSLLKEIKYFEVVSAEGPIHYTEFIEGKRFKSIKDIEKFFNNADTPESGYNKHFIMVMFNDGNSINNFRYDHGLKDDSFSKQLFWYLENNISMEEN